jgi:hypothetical protein
MKARPVTFSWLGYAVSSAPKIVPRARLTGKARAGAHRRTCGYAALAAHARCGCSGSQAVRARISAPL